MANPLVRFGGFIGEVREELKQVAWPSREELIGSLLVVFVGVLLLASFIGVCDFVLSKAAQVLLQR
jgi:preprotein translocase subunit SecE